MESHWGLDTLRCCLHHLSYFIFFFFFFSPISFNGFSALPSFVSQMPLAQHSLFLPPLPSSNLLLRSIATLW